MYGKGPWKPREETMYAWGQVQERLSRNRLLGGDQELHREAFEMALAGKHTEERAMVRNCLGN